MKKFFTVFFTLIIIAAGFFAMDSVEKAFADPEDCPDCDGLVCAIIGEGCFLSALFCLPDSCMDDFYFWYKIDDVSGTWYSVMMDSGVHDCSSSEGCSAYQFEDFYLEVDCEELAYVWQVTCGPTRGTNVECHGTFYMSECN